MLEYITEEDYKELLGVESIPDNFKNLVIEASTYINYHTFGRIDVNDIQEEVKYVTCLIVELLDEKNKKNSNIGNLKSENIEGWSVSYQDKDQIELEYSKEMFNTLKLYLWNVCDKTGTPLMYCGAL